MLTILWLHKHGEQPRDVYGSSSIAYAMLRPGDIFNYEDSDKRHDGSYIVTRRRVTINRAHSTIILTACQCVPEDEDER